jgi:hypothetical protein
VIWAEFDIRQNSAGEFICRHDSFETTPALPDEEWLLFDLVVKEMSEHNRAIKLDLKGGQDVMDRVLKMVVEQGFTDDRLWFNGDIETTREVGFRRIRDEHPDAIVQCPVSWLSPLIVGAPAAARKTLEMLTSWGISRFSVDWGNDRALEMFDQLVAWGYEVNFYSVPHLEAFLEAVLLLPSSVTSDFNFPQWHRYGRGAGKEGRRFTYVIDSEDSH